MLNRLASLVLTIALVGSLGGNSAFAGPTSEPDVTTDRTLAHPASDAVTTAQPSEKLRAAMDKLVADARSGKVSIERPQMQPASSNNLSKGKKIAIGVAIAVAVVAVVVIIRKPRLTGPVL